MAVAHGTATDLAKRVRDARSRLGLTQAEFAARLSVAPLTVHRWESGESRPRRLALERMETVEAALQGQAVPTAAPSPGDDPVPLDFAGDPAAMLLVAEAYRLKHGHQFNPAFATETARIDPLPHQRIAVYERMLPQEPLRFLLADDAGAGKTIMTGLYIREMLTRGRIRRALIVPPAGLVGNWERELRVLFQLQGKLITGPDLRRDNPFKGEGSDLAIISVDTLATPGAFAVLRDAEVEPYDLVVFDEAHKLSVSQTETRTHKTKRYQLAEALAGAPGVKAPFDGLGWACRHLLLLTATPHMGRDSPYFHLWRLLDPSVFGTIEALRRYPMDARQRHFIRRTKEEMVDVRGMPIYPPRNCATFSYDLTEGPDGEQSLYDLTTKYLRQHYRVLDNRPAVQLAMSVFQRRLASSTWALCRSFERRIEKLRALVEEIESGTVNPAALRARQGQLDSRHGVDYFDDSTADDDASPEATAEASQAFEDAVLGAITAVTIEELKDEINTVDGLRARAFKLMAARDESKFVKLREVLEDPDYTEDDGRPAKWLVFSEHRDTVDFLVRRIEGLGYTDQVAVIHGGMPWTAREEQVARFKRPSGARFLIATDAAGEGINLQFCSRMANYDIPWNPARLEQRLGRIHRYGQKRSVQIVNLVAGNTREGHVLNVLLTKLDAIRDELRSDKVFDVIGQLLDGVSLREYMADAVTDESDDAVGRLATELSTERVSRIEQKARLIYGATGEIKPRLDSLRRDLDRERYLQLLPAYVRRFVEGATEHLDIEIVGDLDGVFSLVPTQAGATDALLRAQEQYAGPLRQRLSVRRPNTDEPAIWLRPGEPVFDSLCEMTLQRYARDARRGSVCVDPRADQPYVCHLATVSITEAPAPNAGTSRRTLETRLVTVRQDESAVASEQPIDTMLLLHGAPNVAPGAVPLATRAAGWRADAAGFVEQRVQGPLVDQHRDRCRRALPQRRQRLNVSFDLQAAELASRRATIRTRDVKTEDLEALKTDQRALSTRRLDALSELDDAPERITPGPVQFLAHAVVLPPGAADERHDANVEEVAVRIAQQAELERGASVRDVSRPELARQAGLPDWPGFDLLSRGDDDVRNIEVKGRIDRSAVQLEANEWKQACNLGTGYWLYVVFDCGTPRPRLYRIQDPFNKLLASEKHMRAFTVSVGEITRVAEDADS